MPSFDKALDLGVDGLKPIFAEQGTESWFSFMTISWIISLILQAESRIIHMQNLKADFGGWFPRNTKEQEFCGWMSFCAATAAGSISLEIKDVNIEQQFLTKLKQQIWKLKTL